MLAFLSSPLRRLRLAGLLEGCTLLALLSIAVPLRHIFGVPAASKVMGPVHGLVFMVYLVALIDCIAGGGWTRREAVRAALAALIPFGTFVNDRAIAEKIRREGSA
jgi:integral membrane protein